MSSLREQLQEIYDQNDGRLTPELVLQTARDPLHPLHARFDWDDRSAAESWRREQAHQLIRSVRVVYKPADEHGEQRTVRAFQAVRTVEHGYVYEPVETVALDPFKRQLVLNDMEREWKSMVRRYAQFKEFAEMVRRDVNPDAA